jgi:hypothetical protein
LAAVGGLIASVFNPLRMQMMNAVDPQALFRLSVLGPLVSRERLERGELKRLVAELAQREYDIPNSQRHRLGAKTIEAWYYAWRRLGLEGLVPKTRVDSGRSRIEPALQEAVLAAKRDNPRRSTRQILRLLQAEGRPGARALSRSAVHRLLQQHGLSRVAGTPGGPEERRSFAAEFAGTIWYGDVMHGPRVPLEGQLRKTYLVSLFDDASRLVAHWARRRWTSRACSSRRCCAGACRSSWWWTTARPTAPARCKACVPGWGSI